MIILFLILNFLISWANAWGCGKTWAETKAEAALRSKWPHFLNWCGAVMSGCGFSWCYGVVLGFLASSINYHHSNGVYGPLLSLRALEAFASLGYLAIIFPILGSGLAITIHSWGVAWRERNFSSTAVAGWNSFAQVYNTVEALRGVPEALKNVGDFFQSGDDDEDGVGGAILVALVVGCICAGFLTTYSILTSTARKTARERFNEYSARIEA